MTILRNILGVARYERIMLMRTTRFRALALIGIAIPIFFGVALSIAETMGQMSESTSVFGYSAFIPFYFFTYTQTILIAFVAGNFRAADEQAQVVEVIAARPLSTAELVIGKYVGIVEALVGLSTLVAALTIGIQAAKISILGTPFLLTPYLYYFFLMMLPALIFMSALTFSLGVILHNRTAVALVSIAYIIAVLFFLGTRYGGLFDFGAFFAPLFYSDMAGIGDISRLIEIRYFYLTIAFGMLGLSVARYPRLPQPGMWSRVGHVMAIVGFFMAIGMYVHMTSTDRATIDRRNDLLATQISHGNLRSPEVLHYDMDVQILNGGVPLAATAELLLGNPHTSPLETLIFTLNPGLVVESIADGADRDLPFEIEGSVVRVMLPQPLQPGVEMVMAMRYAGDIDRNGFDLMRGQARKEKWDGPIQKGDLTAWIMGRSVYLPPRSRWYPVPGVDYGNDGFRPMSFSTARLTIETPGGLEVVTQGAPEGTTETDSGRARSVWISDTPVPSFSLNAGSYEIFEAEIGGKDVALYVHRDHVAQLTFLEDALEEITSLVEQLISGMERETGLPYPYPRLSVVEIPFLVQWYYEGWEENGGLTQPGILMIEEDVMLERLNRMQRSIFRTMNSERGRNQDPARVKRNQFTSAIFRVFLESESSNSGLFRSPLVQLWSFNRGFEGENASLLARGMPMYMQEDIASEIRSSVYASGRGGFGDRGRGGGGSGGAGRGRGGGGVRIQARAGGANVTVSIGGRRDSLRGAAGVSWDDMLETMQQTSLADLDPADDPQMYRSILDAKGLTMFRVIEAVVGSDQFVEAIESFAASSQYEDVSFAEFERAVVPADYNEETADQANLARLINDWVYGTAVPGYTLTRVSALKVDDGWGAVVYQVIVRIRNGEPTRGFVQVQVSGRGDEIAKNIEIDGGTEVEVSLVIGVRPGRLTVEPFLAKNRRPLSSPLRIPEEVTPGPPESYVRLVTAEEAAYTEIIVDNEDEGFSMPVRKVQRYMRPALEGGNWRVRTEDRSYAFGRYESNYRTKEAGDGGQPAVWTATLPYAGEYDVAYYYLPERVNGRRILRGAADNFDLTMVCGDESVGFAMRANQLEPGWNGLGRFTFEEGEEVSIELSDLADGRLYADAVRFRYVDPENPNAIYDEGLQPWEFRGGRGGFGGGFPGGGCSGFDRGALDHGHQ